MRSLKMFEYRTSSLPANCKIKYCCHNTTELGKTFKDVLQIFIASLGLPFCVSVLVYNEKRARQMGRLIDRYSIGKKLVGENGR